ncbi:hypothetical protein ACQP3J_33260, partial [Escherichia coli]
VAKTVRGPVTKHLNGVYEKPVTCFLVVTWTYKLHRLVAIKMVPTSTSTMKLDSQEAKIFNRSHAI